MGRTGKDNHRLSGQTKVLGTSHKARKVFSEAGILSHAQFDKVDWEMVHPALHSVPRMFQAFACKQVFDIGGTNRWLAKFDKSGKREEE